MTLTRIPADLGPGVHAWFTGRGRRRDHRPTVGQPGNVSHRRPHRPDDLAADRRAAFAHHGLEAREVHLLEQVHGARVAEITADVAAGTEVPEADGAVTALPGRGVAVLTADCVPVLVGGPRAVGALHAGRRGLAAGIIERGLEALVAAGQSLSDARAAIGPGIGGCCYEVPEEVRDAVAARYPEAASTTTWGSPSLDLPQAAATVLAAAGVEVVQVGACTRCDPRFFSHRADSEAGRQAAVIVRDPEGRAA